MDGVHGADDASSAIALQLKQALRKRRKVATELSTPMAWV
jgi:hypothetical protein